MKQRLVICNEEETGGRARVTRDEERVRQLKIILLRLHVDLLFTYKFLFDIIDL